MESTTYDLIIIGAGPAGENAAFTAALLGKKVAIVERESAVGGAAVNTGTVPSKTLRETALALSGFRSRNLYGVDLSMRGSTVADFLRHERAVKVAEHDQIRGRLDQFGVTMFQGSGSFHDANTIRIINSTGETLLKGERIIIAVGSIPLRPAIFPFEHYRVHDSDELVELNAMPKSLAVVGAGVIGAEYACTFAAMGVKVILIDGRDKLLPFLDGEISRVLELAMEDIGITILWKENVTHCEAPETGYLHLTLASGKKVPVDQVLVCAGRAARTSELKLEAAGITLADKGRIPVNEDFQTNVPHVYAVGDVIGFPALASTSAEQGRIAVLHMFDSSYSRKMAKMLPTGIYTIPEASCVGKTEEELKKEGVDYIVGRAAYKRTPRGKIIGDTRGFLKLLFKRDDLKLLGVHVLGELATELVHTGVVAMLMNQGMDLFLNTCFNYPTLGELYKIASHDALIRRAEDAKIITG
ncbi:Si-specific NAD(P)(+) transhydrogenase [soil metagenome]